MSYYPASNQIALNEIFRNFLDGLYAVADLLTEPDPEPKPPDIDKNYGDDLIEIIITGAVFVTVFCSPTPSKKRTFDFFVKKRRKKLFVEVVIRQL